jgi:secreted protein with Ig-like and vWFA domain
MTAMVPAISIGVDMICSKIQLRPGQPDLKKRMVLLTDGHGNIDEDRLMMVVQKCKEVGVVVDTIGFGRDADEQTLQMISRETGGKYQKADSPLELEAAYQKLNYNQRYLTHSLDKNEG